MPVIWYNPFQPQGSWSDEDQEAAQNAVDTAQTNALVDPNQVEPQGANEEEDLAPMPDLEEYARILQRLAIEQEQDRINPALSKSRTRSPGKSISISSSESGK